MLVDLLWKLNTTQTNCIYTRKLVILVGLLKKIDYNAKISEVEGKLPSISGLATKSALTAVENKISDVSSSVKKTD